MSSTTLPSLLGATPSRLRHTVPPPRSVPTASAASPPPRSRIGARSPLETRTALVAALAVQASAVAQRAVSELVGEVGKYASPRRFEGRSLEESLMSVPDLETVRFKLLKKAKEYELREVEPYFIAETEMPGRTGFSFLSASQAFNSLASYLFGKNTKNEAMEMTTPVYTRRVESDGEKMDMTTPVITKKSRDKDNWKMSFVMPFKYSSKLPMPLDPSIKILEVPSKIVAVAAFSGFVTDDEVEHRESRLREALKSDPEYQIKDGASVEVAQFNPPFTLPFTRRNEVSLEVERKNV